MLLMILHHNIEEKLIFLNIFVKINDYFHLLNFLI